MKVTTYQVGSRVQHVSVPWRGEVVSIDPDGMLNVKWDGADFMNGPGYISPLRVTPESPPPAPEQP